MDTCPPAKNSGCEQTRKRKRVYNWHSGLHAVMKAECKDCHLSEQACKALDSMVNDIGHRVCDQAQTLMHAAKRETVMATDVESGVKILCSDEALRNKLENGMKRAVIQFNKPVSCASKTDEKKKNSQKVRAGLLMAPSRMAKRMRDKWHVSKRISASAPVALTAAAEYVVAMLLKQARDACKAAGKKTITDRHLHLAILKSEGLTDLVGHALLPKAGVAPPEPKSSKKKSSSKKASACPK